MFDTDRYVRTETKFSIVGSILVTVVFYVLAFGVLEPVSSVGSAAMPSIFCRSRS